MIRVAVKLKEIKKCLGLILTIGQPKVPFVAPHMFPQLLGHSTNLSFGPHLIESANQIDRFENYSMNREHDYLY